MCVCMCVCVCVCVCVGVGVCLSVIISLYGWGYFCVLLIQYLGFMGILFFCLVGYFSMNIWTPAVLSILYACVLCFCICTCSAQLSIFYMERCSRNRLIIIIIIINKYM